MFLAVPTINTPGVSRAADGSFAYLLGFPQNLRQQENCRGDKNHTVDIEAIVGLSGLAEQGTYSG